ncbi:MAG: hypothetical protein ACFFCW_38120 [Candidatus Hodarchaeota archaeon]
MNNKQPHKKKAKRLVLALLVVVFISMIVVQVGAEVATWRRRAYMENIR